VKFLRKMKSLNLANNVEETRFILFPSETHMLKQVQMACEAFQTINTPYSLAYYHDTSGMKGK
jgi:hypothetical protein